MGDEAENEVRKNSAAFAGRGSRAPAVTCAFNQPLT